MKNIPFDAKVSRRSFLASGAAAAAAITFPTIIPISALGGDGKPAASERIVMGVLGWGMQGPQNTRAFLALPDVQVVAACDLEKKPLGEALDAINGKYGNKDCASYQDYREMMARTDLDAVMLAVPDHWHALVATTAANRKFDIYGEKPLARTIAEQQAIVHAVEKNHCIWQTGSWQRSERNFHTAAEIVRNGLIGTVTHVEVGLPAGHADFGGTAPALLKKLGASGKGNEYITTVVPGTPDWDKAVTDPPADFDFNIWTGPSKMEPYIEARINKNWRWNYNCGGGQLMDWIGHHCDIAHWGLDFDRSGPSEIEGHGEFPARNAIWNTAGKYRIELKYPRNITMTIAGGHDDIRSGTKWIGTDGWVWVDRGPNSIEGSNPEWHETKKLPEDQRKIKLYESTNHWKNFIDCVKSRQPTIAPVQTAHHSAIPGHLGLISMMTGRKIYWDVASERILHDSEASRMLTREYRAPYKFPAPVEIIRSPKGAAAAMS
jgi:predicted dehydrogenase